MATPRIRKQAFLVAVLLGACAPSCAPLVQSAPTDLSAPETSHVSDRLYFGRSIPEGGTVSEAEWSSFLNEYVTPRFPSGLTVWRAEGQWRDASAFIVREENFVLELIHEPDAESDQLVREVVAEYKRRFRQESVLRVRAVVKASF